MSPKQRQRLVFVVILLVGFSAATGLVLYSLERNLLYFFTPTQVLEKIAPQGRTFSLGGMVVENSIQRGETIRFSITDYQSTVEVTYKGLLPDLFGEGQGVVANGTLNAQGVFEAETVLAKHDENYMPPNVAESLKEKPVGIVR